jgi:hypothetical protein
MDQWSLETLEVGEDCTTAKSLLEGKGLCKDCEYRGKRQFSYNSLILPRTSSKKLFKCNRTLHIMWEDQSCPLWQEYLGYGTRD